jgi:hypothetical protein
MSLALQMRWIRAGVVDELEVGRQQGRHVDVLIAGWMSDGDLEIAHSGAGIPE